MPSDTPSYLYHEEFGSPEMPAVVFLHGLLDRGERFSCLARKRATDLNCFVVDLAGHGNSFRLSSYETTRHAREVARFTTNIVRRPAIFVGHSLGGVIATETAARWPEKVQGLLLEDSPLYDIAATDLEGTQTRRGFPDWVALLREVHSLVESDLDAVEALVGRSRVGALDLGSLPRDEQRWIAKSISLVDPNVMLPYLPGARCGFDPNLIRRITCPTTLLNGAWERGGQWRDATLQRLSDDLPHAEVIKEESAGHHIWTASPNLFEHALDRLIRRAAVFRTTGS